LSITYSIVDGVNQNILWVISLMLKHPLTRGIEPADSACSKTYCQSSIFCPVTRQEFTIPFFECRAWAQNISELCHTQYESNKVPLSQHENSSIPSSEQLSGRFDLIMETMKLWFAQNPPLITLTRTEVRAAICGKHSGSPG